MSKPAKRKMLPMRQGDVPRTYASPDFLVALTGRKPDTGVRRFVEWYLELREELGL